MTYENLAFGNGRLVTQLKTFKDPLLRVWTWNHSRDANGKLQSVTVTTPTYKDALGTGMPAIQTSVTFGARGQITGFVDGEGTPTKLVYDNSTASGRYLLRKGIVDESGHAVDVAFEADDLGRLRWIEPREGSGRKTMLTSDLYGRRVATQSPPGPGNQPIASELYYDRAGNLTVSRQENRDQAGASRSRPWVVAETLHDRHDRVERTNQDQAPLSDSSADVLVTTFEYLADHRPWKVHLPNGSTTQYTWDGYGLPYQVVRDTGGLAVQSDRLYFDEDDFLTQVKNADGKATTLTPDGYGQLEFVEDAVNGKVRLYRDALGRAWKAQGMEKASGLVLTWAEWEFDELGRPMKRHRQVLDGSGSPTGAETVRLFYNRRSQLLEVRHPHDRGVTYTYDTAGRRATVIDQSTVSGAVGPGNEIEYRYESNSARLWRVLSKALVAADFAIPPGGSSTQRVHTVEFGHDLLDRVVSRKLLREAGQTTGPAEILHSYAYDSLDNRVEYLDANGAKLRWAHDGFGRVVARTEVGTQADTVATSTTFILNGTETRIERQDGMTPARVTNYLFDKAGRLTEIRYPGWTSGTAHRRLFGYDAVSRIDQITTGNGTVVQQVYDDASRLKNRIVTTLGTDVSTMATREDFGHDALGRLTSAETYFLFPGTASLVKVAVDRDSLQRQTKEGFTFFATAPELAVTSGYGFTGGDDYLFRRTLGYPSGHAITLTPDGVGKLAQVDLQAPGQASRLLARYRYFGAAPLERELSWGTQAGQHHDTFFEWDGQRRLRELRVETPSPSELWRWELERGTEGHLLKDKYFEAGTFHQAGSKYHDLTEFYSLKGTKIGVPEADFGGSFANAGYQIHEDFALDKGHNRTQTTETVQGSGSTVTSYVLETDSHRYDSVGGVDHGYDGEGNLRTDGSFVYVYDFRNRLSEVYTWIAPPESLTGGKPKTQPTAKDLQTLVARARYKWVDERKVEAGFESLKTSESRRTSSQMGSEGDLQLVALYGYDPFNRRVYRAVTGLPVYYSVYDGWREVEELTPGDPPTGVRAYVWGAGLDEQLAYARNDAPWVHWYVHQERFGSVHKVVDGSGAVVESFDYRPYGQPTASSAIGNPYQWVGRRRDAETGLWYFRNRYYSSTLGRFLTRDPLGVWGDAAHYGNGYAYGGNSPLSFADPYGTQVLLDGLRYIAQGVEAAIGALRRGLGIGGHQVERMAERTLEQLSHSYGTGGDLLKPGDAFAAFESIAMDALGSQAKDLGKDLFDSIRGERPDNLRRPGWEKPRHNLCSSPDFDLDVPVKIERLFDGRSPLDVTAKVSSSVTASGDNGYVSTGSHFSMTWKDPIGDMLGGNADHARIEAGLSLKLGFSDSFSWGSVSFGGELSYSYQFGPNSDGSSARASAAMKVRF